MIGFMCLALVALALPGGDPIVRLAVAPLTAEVGQRVEITLELEVDSADVLDQPFDFDSAFDDSWVVFDLRRSAPLRAATVERAITLWTFELASLEPGTRSLTEALVEPLGFAAFLEGDAPKLEIASVLAADATEPRPLIGFSDLWLLDGVEDASPWLTWLIGGPVLLVFGLGLWLAMRRGKQPASGPPTRSIAERASTLELALLRSLTLDRLRERVFGLTSLVREAVDARRGTREIGATDEEWLARVLGEARIDAATREELSVLFETTTRIKYRGERPSDFALDELGRRGQALLDAELRLAPETAA